MLKKCHDIYAAYASNIGPVLSFFFLTPFSRTLSVLAYFDTNSEKDFVSRELSIHVILWFINPDVKLTC